MDPTSWNSLQDQSETGWEEVPPGGGADPKSALSELNLTGSKAITPGQVVSVGNAYDVSSGIQDLSFSYSLAGNTEKFIGEINYDGGIHVRVNKSTGRVAIVNPEPTDIDFNAYGIQSAAGLLNPTTWNSLQDRGEPDWNES